MAQDPADADTVTVSPPETAVKEDRPAVQDSFFMRQVPDSVMLELKKQRTFAYANDSAYWLKKPYEPSAFERLLFYLFNHSWVKWITFIILGILLGYALFRILQSAQLNLFFTRNGRKPVATTTDDVTQDWTDQLAMAEAAGDYRMAIRFQYLQTLQVLARKEMLIYHPENTNQEYLDQLRGNSAFDNFSRLTQIYEYAWYGGFPITESIYRQAAALFQSFQASVSG